MINILHSIFHWGIEHIALLLALYFEGYSMPSLLTPRELLSIISLSRALTLAQLAKNIAVVPNLSHNLIITTIQNIYQQGVPSLYSTLGRLNAKRFLSLLNSLGLWHSSLLRTNGLSIRGIKLLSFNQYEKYLYLRKIIANWEPMKVLREYLEIVGGATVTDINRDLGWAMIIRTKTLIQLGLITWRNKPFAKPFNKHIIHAILVKLGVEYGLLEVTPANIIKLKRI